MLKGQGLSKGAKRVRYICILEAGMSHPFETCHHLAGARRPIHKSCQNPVKNHYIRERTTKGNRKYTQKCSYEWQVLKEESLPWVELLIHI